MDTIIDPMQSSDWQAVRAIYLDGIATGNATFETDAPEWQDWDLHHLQVCRLVARKNGKVVDWAHSVPCPAAVCMPAWLR